MKCAQCGLPLSPKRNSCPRCGTPISANTSNQTGTEDSPLQMPFPTQLPPQLPFPSNEGWQGTPPFASTQEANMQTAFPNSSLPSPPTSYATTRPNPLLAHKPSPSTRGSSKTTRMGFTIAALCIITGSFLLVFVYFIGRLPGGSALTSSGSTAQLTTVASGRAATATQDSMPTTPVATPTPILPGQGLLDTSVLASNFNEHTGQIIQQASSFQVNQKIYVILSLHPGGNSHAACLNWYLNNQLVNTFSFEVDPSSNYKYYSYTTMSNPGNGRVSISLASTIACTNALPTRELSFKVT